MKKFLIELKDTGKDRKVKYIVRAENAEEAFNLAVEYYKKLEGRNEKTKGA